MSDIEIKTQRKLRREKKRKAKKVHKRISIFFLLLVIIYVFHINLGDLLGNILQDTEACATTEYEAYEDPYKDVPLHTYNWDNLSKVNNKITYSESKGFEAKQGIDVSKYQGNIDWDKVYSSGISYAMLRIGYRGYENGKIIIDEKFSQNIKQATAAKVKVGVYFFSQAINTEEAIEEANFVLENIDGYNLSFPIVFDLEEISSSDHRTVNLTKQERTEIATAFCEKIKNAGYTPMIYGNSSWLTNYYDLTEIIKYDIWLAQYSNKPTFPYDFQMWQYTNAGYVEGINHIVDINLCFTTY